MVDTQRTLSELLTLWADGQPDGIGIFQFLRDNLKSIAPPFGRAYVSGNATATTINTIGIFEVLAGTFLNGMSSDVTFSAVGGRLTYDGASDRHFHVVSNFDMTAAANNQTVQFQWFKNGSTALPVAINQRVGTGTDVRTMSVHTDVMLSTNDYVELKVANTTSTADVTVSNAYLFIMGMFG